MTPVLETRRGLLQTSALAAALLAGCSDAGTSGPSPTGGAVDPENESSPDPESDETARPPDDEENVGSSGSVATTDTTGQGSETPLSSDSEHRVGDDIDLREANVVAVETSRTGDRYRFDVTLHHDDDGEDGYADWWQVETLPGERLGRRDLLHPHGTREFTRSATVSLPPETTCVVVRGHDQTHGYGGRAVLVDPTTGATRTVAQGPDPRSLDRTDCPVRR